MPTEITSTLYSTGMSPHLTFKVINFDKAIRKQAGSCRHLELSEFEEFRDTCSSYILPYGLNYLDSSEATSKGKIPDRKELCSRQNDGVCTYSSSSCHRIRGYDLSNHPACEHEESNYNSCYDGRSCATIASLDLSRWPTAHCSFFTTHHYSSLVQLSSRQPPNIVSRLNQIKFNQDKCNTLSPRALSYPTYSNPNRFSNQ
jgi:hypothetical protein